ncbi:histidine kinase dimerization/phosphoacceptor domain -containing protein [Ancylobacter sp. G4_0304]|uniref:histidine kinase dimerization/phosphoacceptor domain -containing protein n=1 Tax=Ancylobacter sp. G4_0304 TaxID=3114289 RepID=UPI0039C6C870
MKDSSANTFRPPAFWRLMDAVQPLRRHRLLGDLCGILLFALALGLRVLVDDVLPAGFPFLTFFPAVILSTFMCGLRPGIVCAVLSTLAAWYFFIGPATGMVLTGQAAMALGFFTVIAAIDIALVHITFTAAERLRQEKAVTAKLYEEQRTMFQELRHRVANNMQFVAALLILHRREAAQAPERALATLDEARRRLETIARLHRRLYDPDRLALPIEPYLRELCRDLLEAAGARAVVCHVSAPAVTLSVARLTTLSLLVAEIVTNSLKHAFGPHGVGSLDVTLSRLSSDRYELAIVDDGPGLPVDFDPANSPSLGLRIIQGLAGQLDGKVRFENRGGTAVLVEFNGGG